MAVPARGSACAWSGEVDHNNGNFNARNVNLDDGNSNWNNVDNPNIATVCVP